MNHTKTSQNFDRQELAKFAALAAHWWDPNGTLKTLHQINPLRIGYIEEKTVIKDKKIIDIGCGGGILTESLAVRGAEVTGIDLNKPLIDAAKLHQLESHANVEYLHTSIEDFAVERPRQYDILTCLELLEHVPDPLSIIRACAQLVKPNGQLFFSTLNRNPKSYFFAIIGAEYILKMLPKNTHDYAKFIRPAELNAWLASCQLTTQEIKGISYQHFSRKFRLSDHISVNYLLHAVS